LNIVALMAFAVGRGACDLLGSNVAGPAGVILDDEGLPEPLRQRLTDQARDDVGGGAGAEAFDQLHRPRRIIKRSRAMRCGRQHGST
jgi:hypothetical protein